MSENNNDTLAPKDLYEEIGKTYRYFLNWRHALFAGYLVSLYALSNGFAWLVDNEYNETWLVPIFSFGVLLAT